MAFFLETLIGGLMTGMLYSLIALGFVLIFKASGVFNFAQGAMVLFAALAMARFCGMDSRVAGIDSKLRGQPARPSSPRWRCMFVRGLGDRAPGAAPPGQPGGHHPADGHPGHHLLPRRRWARRCSAADIYKIDVGMPKEPAVPVRERVPGRRAGRPGRRNCRADRRRAGGAAGGCSSRRPAPAARCALWPTTTRRRSRSAFRSTASGSSSGGGRLRGPGGRDHLGLQARRAVLADHRWRCAHCRW